MTDEETKAALDHIINGLCKSRKRHDSILTRCVKDCVRMPVSWDPIKDFAMYLSRRLLKNESVAVNMLTITAAFPASKQHAIPENGLDILQKHLRTQPPQLVLESQPVLNQRTHKAVMLVISRHAFRVLEITHDIWKVLNPEATPEQKERNEYLANIAHVSENLGHMGMGYGANDIVDCLNLIAPEGAFYLRAGFLFNASLEFQPFVDTIEGKGFQVNILIDENETEAEFKEHDILKRLQGLLITKSEPAMARAMQHIDFLQELTRTLPLPNTDLAKPLQLG